MDAQAEFDLVLAQVEARLADRRHRAGAERHAHRTERRGRAARDAGDFGERQAALGGRAGELVDEHGAGDAAAAVARDKIAQRDVVGDDHDLDRDALLAGQFGGEAEVQPVAGVVLDDEDGARRAADRADRGQDGVGAGRGEDVAGDRCRQHAAADIARMGRLMAAAAARDDRHLALGRSRHVCPDHHVLAVEQSEARGEVDHSLEQFANEMPRVVDELLHEDPLEMTGSRARSETAR